MKSLITYQLIPDDCKFYLVDGDFSRLNGCIINLESESNYSEADRDLVSDPSQVFGKELTLPFVLPEGEKIILVTCGFML